MEKIAAADKMRMQMLCERLTACVAAIDGHFEHSNFVHLHPHLSTKKWTLFRATHMLPKKTRFETVKTKDQLFPRWCSSINHYVGEMGKLSDFCVFSRYTVCQIL